MCNRTKETDLEIRSPAVAAL